MADKLEVTISPTGEVNFDADTGGKGCRELIDSIRKGLEAYGITSETLNISNRYPEDGDKIKIHC
jgi:hypothetical protein